MTSDDLADAEALWVEMLAAWQQGDHRQAASLALGSADLAGLAPIVSEKGPLVIAQLGQSLDGRIAAQNGESRYINGPKALAHLHRLRALVDAVVVGAGTVSQDNPRLTVRHVAGENPLRVAIDPSARLSQEHQMFSDGASPTLRIVGEQAVMRGADDLALATRQSGQIEPSAIIAALRNRGASRLLIEGGAKTIATFLEAGLVDRLHLLVGPIILGAGRPGIDLPAIQTLDQALRPTVTTYPLGGDTLFDCVF